MKRYVRKLIMGAHCSASSLLFALSLAATASAANESCLWNLGTVDRNAKEFALAPSGCAKYDKDPYFQVGISDVAKDWPYVLPGPLDNWAGRRAHAGFILFNLDAVAAKGEGRLLIDLVDTHPSVAPLLRVRINGRQSEFRLPLGTGLALYGRVAEGKPHQVIVNISVADLQRGVNTVEIASDTGSWIIYDAIRLMMPEGTRLGRTSDTYTAIAQATVTCRIVEKDGKDWQPVDVTMSHWGDPEDAVLTCGEVTMPVRVAQGENKVQLLVPALERERKVDLNIALPRQRLQTQVEVKPPLDMSVITRKAPSWLSQAVFYQIFPQSFCDTNADGIGDLNGIIAKLDYIKSIGANAIWLNPIYDSPFNDAGYDVNDYCLVAPRYGTNADAKRLFDEAHRRGIKVLLDLVAGHCSDQNAWFKDSCLGPQAKHADWFMWSDHKPDANWVKSPGPRPGYYLKNFFDSQPALNYGYSQPNEKNPWERPVTDPGCRQVREAMRGVMRFWLDLGCDGFRVDMAPSLIKGGGKELTALWQDYRNWINTNYPEAVLVSEWGNPSVSISSGFDIDFYLHCGEPAYQYLVQPSLWGYGKNVSFFSRQGAGNIAAFVGNYLPHYEATRALGLTALPTCNHDFSRPRSHGRELEDLKVLHTMLLTMPGAPFIYYGDEIGMRDLRVPGYPQKEGSMWRASCRSPMQWEPGERAGFSTGAPASFYLPIDPDPKRPNVADQQSDPTSMLNHLRALTRLRAQEPSLGNLGGFRVLYAEAKTYPFVYLRTGGPSSVLVAINPINEPRTWKNPRLAGATTLLAQHATLKGAQLNLGPVSFAILRLPAASK